MGYVIRFCQTNSVNCVGGAFLRHGIVRRDSRRNVSFLLPAFKRITARDKGTAIRRRFTRKKRICAAIISKDNYAMIGFIQKASRRKFELLGLLEIPSKYVKMITKQYYMGPEIKGYFKNWKVKHSKEYIRIQNQENDEFYSEQEELDSNDEIYGTDQNSETSENLKDRDQWITYEIGEKDGENDIIVVDDEKSGSSDCEIIETDDSDNETLFDKFNLQVRTKELFESRPQPPAKRTYQKREGKVITVEDLTCTTCNKVFNHLSTLKNHIKKHLPFEFICHICELEFSVSLASIFMNFFTKNKFFRERLSSISTCKTLTLRPEFATFIAIYAAIVIKVSIL